MYLRKLELTNFRAFPTLEWSLNEGEEAGWHVLIGPNGSGKSGFLRAIAIALTGSTEFTAARRPTADFIRNAPNVSKADIGIDLSQTAGWDVWEGQGRTATGLIKASVTLSADGSIKSSAGKHAPRTLWGGRGTHGST